MIDKIEEIKTAALKQLEGIDNAKDLESWRVQYLGKKSQHANSKICSIEQCS